MKKNIIFIACILLAVIGFSLWSTLGGKPGTAAVVDIPGQEPVVLSLAQDGNYDLEGKIPVHLEIANGSIRFVNSECPDHVCEKFGWLSRVNDQATCAPAGVVVHVERMR